MELVLVELNTGAELDATESAEVAGAKIVGYMDLGSGRGKRMERGRNGRREFRRRAGSASRVRPARAGGGRR
jgi:hypothetical protein